MTVIFGHIFIFFYAIIFYLMEFMLQWILYFVISNEWFIWNWCGRYFVSITQFAQLSVHCHSSVIDVLINVLLNTSLSVPPFRSDDDDSPPLWTLLLIPVLFIPTPPPLNIIAAEDALMWKVYMFKGKTFFLADEILKMSLLLRLSQATFSHFPHCIFWKYINKFDFFFIIPNKISPTECISPTPCPSPSDEEIRLDEGVANRADVDDFVSANAPPRTTGAVVLLERLFARIYFL